MYVVWLSSIVRRVLSTIASGISSETARSRVGWLVGFGFNGPLRQYFSLYRAVFQREGDRGEKG